MIVMRLLYPSSYFLASHLARSRTWRWDGMIWNGLYWLARSIDPVTESRIKKPPSSVERIPLDFHE